MSYPNLQKKSTLRGHLSRALAMDALSQDEEYSLIEEWQKNMNKAALSRLIQSHYKLLKKIARGYSKYGVTMDDLMAEGYLGCIQAANNFKLEHGFRFSTYLTRSIKNFLQKWVMKTSSIVSVKPDNDNRKLFFQLKRVKNEILGNQDIDTLENLSDEELGKFETALDVSKEKIKSLSQKLFSADVSLNAKINNDEDSIEYQDLIKDKTNVETDIIEKEDFRKKSALLQKALHTLTPKEHRIFAERRLNDEPKTLAELGEIFGMSSERIRQIEHKAFLKISKHLKLCFYKSGGKYYCTLIFC